MKNKKQIYILLPIVILVWGLIGYRIFKAFSGDDETNIAFNPIAYTPIAKDTLSAYELQLNYPDPFLKRGFGVASSKPKVVVNNTNKKRQPKKVKKAIPLRWPVINYKGFIQKNGEQATYILEINGSSQFMSIGDELNELKLLKGYKDSVHVEFQSKEKRTIKKL